MEIYRVKPSYFKSNTYDFTDIEEAVRFLEKETKTTSENGDWYGKFLEWQGIGKITLIHKK
jgi:hypothetical protein